MTRIHKRYYALARKNVSLLPHKYLLGHFMLQAPRTISVLVQEEARKRQEKFENLWFEFKKGIKRREHQNVSLLHSSGKNIVKGIKHYGETTTAKVLSKSRQGEFYNDVFLRRKSIANYRGSKCSCQDEVWQHAKWPSYLICAHLAAVDLFTGAQGSHPFRVRELEEELFSSILEYYLHAGRKDEISAFELDRTLLERQDILSSELKPAQREYLVIRQKGVEHEEDVLQIYQDIDRLLKTRGFYRIPGYSLEFKGRDFESVLIRYKNSRGELFDVTTLEDGESPLIIKREFTSNPRYFISSDDTIEALPSQRIGRTFETLDDRTRRYSRVKFIVPGQEERSEVRVSPRLQERYRELVHN